VEYSILEIVLLMKHFLPSRPCLKSIALFWVITQRVVVISYRRFRQPISPIFKGQKSLLGFLTLEDGTDKLSRNVGNTNVITQKNAVLIYFTANA
jgi:hypothetical protein